MKKLAFALTALALFLVSCNKDEDPVVDPTLTLNIQGLENLGSGYAYEGWIIVDGSPVTTGTFTVDDAGTLSATSFTVNEDDLNAATSFVLSVEPVPDPDPAPSAVKYLSGDFNANTASVNTGIVGDYSQSSGKFLLATPTTTTDADDLSGVWFIDNGAAGLDLPTLPEGWAYEGWAVIDGVPVSTGTFTSVEGADNDGSFSGTDAAAPPFPGEDFIINAPDGLTFPTDLTNAPIVISIEPVPDNSPAPFTLKPLTGASPASGTMVGTSYSMDQNLGSFPTGTVQKNIQ